MNHPEKQLKYSIRKVSVGAASVVIGALYLLMGAGIAHADGMESAREAERAANPTDPEQSGNGKTGNKPDLSNTDAAASTYNAPVAENPLVAPESTKPRTRGKRDLPDGDTSGTSNGATGTESGDNQPTSEDSPALDANRKGDTVKEHQPGVVVPKDGEEGADDKNANLRFDTPKENLTLEELWDIVKNMPDDFQNNERSYLRNMNTLGDALNLKPGEIRELHDFGGWHAIDKDGTKGKFVIGRKNEQGYFTGWRMKEDGTIEQGGMLGGDALDNIYVHEQALDRRFRYMLMLVKGRTRANRDETVSDKSEYDPRAQNERADSAGTPYKNLPFLEKDTYDKYSPGVVGYNGIEKQFTAFSPKFGSRVRVEFVTGYISDVNNSKGTYRVVIKTKNTAGQENTVYDQTIHRVAEIVQNEDLYKKGLNVEQANSQIMKFFKDEFHYRVIQIRNEKVKNSSLNRVNKNKYTEAQKELYNKLDAEATEEAKKQGDIVMNVDKDFMSISKSNKAGSDWKKTFTKGSSASLANTLNNLLKEVEKDTPDTPTWLNSSTPPAQADDRTYKLMNVLIPGAKKITYHVNDDQLEVETEKYSYLAARNGSKEVGIQGSDVAATGTANDYNANPDKFELINTNTKVNERNGGWAKSNTKDFQEFSRFIGVDKGIKRTNVISDKDLSDKIRAAVGPGDSNLGKGGYFSTGDVLLGTDVVSYTVQVFSENNERVGVNPQSHRVQYNLPILADFSVIQDTVEPSRNVVEKIIPKLNIPEEEKKKITEKIKEKKKTSELADLISGNVKVRYVDEQGNLLSLKNDTGIGEKESDGTYITNKKQLIGTSYNVTDKKLSTISTTNGKHYRAKRDLGENSDPTEGNIVNGVRTITYVYEEREAPTTATVTANYYKEGTQEKLAESVVKADLAIGSEYTTEAKTIEGKTTTEDKEDRVITRKTTYTLVATPANATGTVPEDGATVNYYYRENVEETVVPKTEDVQESKTVTRTIKYVDKENEATEVATPVTQTVTLTRTNKRNKVTKVVTEGTWSTGNWDEKASPSVENYGPAETATVSSATVTSASTDETVVVKYPQAIEDVQESKTVTRTIKYVDKENEATEVATPVTQTVTLTRTNKRNKVTGEVTEGTWSTGNWDEKASPSVENYGPAETATVSSATVTSASTDETVVVKYPQAIEDVQESKTVTRTIKYVDKENEATEVATPVTQTVTLTRTNKRNKVTGEVTEGTWSTGTWATQVSPTVTNYDAPDTESVAEATVTSTTDNTTVVVKYPQAIEDVKETKTVTRTIKYVDKANETKEVADSVTQTVELTRTNKRNKVTGEVTEGAWSTGTWATQVSPTVTNYDAPDTESVAEATVTSTTTDTTEVVKYPQAIEDVKETKTITRTIKYVDATDETTEVASPVTQTVELTRTNKRNKVTGKVTEGNWSTGTWGSQTSPTVTNYDAPDKATVAEATVTSATTDTTEVVKYPQATEDVVENKTITRTIKYVDATDEATEVASPVTQTVELTRTNKRNKVTGKVTEGTWSTGTWGSQTSPTVTNYDAPDKETVAEATVTSTTTDTTEVVKYPQATEDVTETKTVTRTIKYVDATDETKEVASPVTQTVELTRTNKRNKVTGKVTEGAWSTGTWAIQVSPTVTNYDAPDTESVAEATVTSTTDNTTVVVKYPQAIEDVQESKTVTRTIKYVDKENEATEVATPVTQTVTLTRTNKRNKVTKVVTEGTWTTGNWDEKASPSVENYGPAETATVSSATVTSASTDETVVVKYPQAIEDVQETKTVTRTIKYVDATDETTEVSRPVTQTVELTRTNKRNKVTGKVTEGDWSTGNWDEKTSPSVENYDAPDTESVAETTVTSTTDNTTVVVKYPQSIADEIERKTVTRTIKYVDATDETTEVASPVTQTVELTRTNKRNKVTGKVTEGTWSTGNWEAKASPSVENYDAPDKATVAEATVTSTTTDTTEVVKYPQATEDITETKTVTRTIKYVDATDETREVADSVTQTVELTRTNKRNKVTGKVTEGTWSTGNWEAKASPSVENYDAPDKATVAEETVTSTTTDTTEVVKYPQATEDITETKTVTRTIKYVDATDETREVADSVTQTVELTRTNKRNKVTGKVTEGDWSTGNWDEKTSPSVENYDTPDKATVAEATVTSTTTDTTEVVKYPQATEDVKETKTVTRTIKYVDATDETTEVSRPVTQTVELTRTNKRNKVTGKVTEGDWSTGNWDEVVSPEIANYGKPDLPKVSNEEVTANSKDTTILIRYDRLSTPDKPTPEKPEIPNPQEPGTPDVPNPDKPTPQPNPEPTPEPDTPRPETPVNPDSEVPTYETGKREVRERSLPNTGTKANATLASAGIMTLLAGLGLGFFKKKEDESE